MNEHDIFGERGAKMGDEKCRQTLGGKPEEKRPSGRIVLKWIWQKWDVRLSARQGPTVGFVSNAVYQRVV